MNSIDEICVPVIKKILGHYLELNPNYNNGLTQNNNIMTKEKLDDYMASRGYSYINGECREDGTEYVRRYMHKNGISELSFTERFGKWENCF